MRNYTKLLLVAGAGLSLFALPCGVGKAAEPAAVRSDQPMTFPAGFQNVTGAPDSGVYSGLAKVTERAVTKGDFDKMLAELATPDKDRASGPATKLQNPANRSAKGFVLR